MSLQICDLQTYGLTAQRMPKKLDLNVTVFFSDFLQKKTIRIMAHELGLDPRGLNSFCAGYGSMERKMFSVDGA